MEYNVLAPVITSLLIVAAAAIGVKYQKLKAKAGNLRSLIDGLVKAWEDDVLTEEELKALVERAKALLED